MNALHYISIEQVQEGHLLGSNIYSGTGHALLRAGVHLTTAVIIRLKA